MAKEEKIELKDEERTKTECWSRVMGYFRPVSWYNIGKQQEFKDRVYFKEPSHEEIENLKNRQSNLQRKSA